MVTRTYQLMKKNLQGIIVKTDAEGEGKVREISRRVANMMNREIGMRAAGIARTLAWQVGALNKEYIRKVVSAGQGRGRANVQIDIFRDTPDLKKILDNFTKENTKLITDISDKMILKIEKKVVQYYENGIRVEKLAKVLEDEHGIAKRRAKLIARDQTAKLNGQLTVERFKANGITKSIWRTVGDERVREEHEELEGQEFDNASGIPGVGLPGEPINCRCYAEPILD